MAAGLIIATGIKLIGALRTSAMGATACALLAGATFGAIAVLRWPLLWVLVSVGGAGCAWAWVCLGRQARPPAPPPAGPALTDADSGQTP